MLKKLLLSSAFALSLITPAHASWETMSDRQKHDCVNSVLYFDLVKANKQADFYRKFSGNIRSYGRDIAVEYLKYETKIAFAALGNVCQNNYTLNRVANSLWVEGKRSSPFIHDFIDVR